MRFDDEDKPKRTPWYWITKERCETCKFYSGKNCLRYPPQPPPIRDVRPAWHYQIEMRPNDWCGEYQKRPDLEGDKA